MCEERSVRWIGRVKGGGSEGGEKGSRGGRGSEDSSRLTRPFIRIHRAHGLLKRRRVSPLIPHLCAKQFRRSVIRIFLAARPPPPEPQRRTFHASLRIRSAGAQAPRVLIVTNDGTLIDRCREIASAPVEVARRGRAVGAVFANRVDRCWGGEGW